MWIFPLSVEAAQKPHIFHGSPNILLLKYDIIPWIKPLRFDVDWTFRKLRIKSQGPLSSLPSPFPSMAAVFCAIIHYHWLQPQQICNRLNPQGCWLFWYTIWTHGTLQKRDIRRSVEMWGFSAASTDSGKIHISSHNSLTRAPTVKN